jgi:hypothetical protein
MNVRSLRLADEGTSLVVGGIVPSSLSGRVVFLDFSADAPTRWMRNTSIGVGLVDIDAQGARVIAVEDPVGGYALRVFETTSGTQLWGRHIDGSIARDDAGTYGGAALAPDGSIVVIGTLREGLRVYDGADGSPRWSYRSEGTTVVTFRREMPPLFAANARLVPNGPPDAVLLFSPEQEPVTASFPAMSGVILLVGALAGLSILGAGYWRVRRTY